MAIRSLQQEQPCEDLEEAAKKHAKTKYGLTQLLGCEQLEVVDDFIAGAEWQKEQMLKGDRLTELDKSYKQAKRELEWFKEGKRQGREQMLKDAVEGEVCGRVYDHINIRFADGVSKYLEPKNISHIPADISKYAIGDKVKVVIVPEKEE